MPTAAFPPPLSLRRLTLRLSLVVCLALTAACTFYIDRDRLPVITDGTYPQKVKTVVLPLPIFAADRNEGVTWGLQTGFILHDRNDEAAALLTPQVNVNRYYGMTTGVYTSLHAGSDRSAEGEVLHGEHGTRRYELSLRDRSPAEGSWDLRFHLYDFTDGSARFFGFGPGTTVADESNFADTERGGEISAGYRITRGVEIAAADRVRQVRVGRGVVATLPLTQRLYPESRYPGTDGFFVHAQSATLTWSGFDDAESPQRGAGLRLVVEGSAPVLGSGASWWRYEAEARGYLPAAEARMVTAVRLAYARTVGRDAPFLERSILGGENTLRGYGRGRFTGESSLLLNVEERLVLARRRLFNLDVVWQTVPFVDIGGVTASGGGVSTFVVNPGIGFRGVVGPHLSGRIDLGFGSDGTTVFVGLGLPY